MIAHFEKVVNDRIEAEFTSDKEHRACLTVPLQERDESQVLCVIGQNPSLADKYEADKTLRYIEEYVFRKMQDFGMIKMLNVYSKVDTYKAKQTDLVRLDVEREVNRILSAHTDYLIVTGKPLVQGGYDFPKRMRLLSSKVSGKNIYKINTGSNYPPHPGNPKITYSNFTYDPAAYNFEDVT